MTTSGGEGAGAQARVSAVVTCDNSTGSAVYVLSMDEVVSDGKWLMSADMDHHALVHRYVLLLIPGSASHNLAGLG